MGRGKVRWVQRQWSSRLGGQQEEVPEDTVVGRAQGLVKGWRQAREESGRGSTNKD